MDNHIIVFMLFCIICIIQINDIHMKKNTRAISHNFMLFSDLFAIYVFYNKYIETNNQMYLMPIIIGMYCYFIVGFNKPNVEREWAILNGLVLGISGMS